MSNEINLTSYSSATIKVEHNRDLFKEIQCMVYSGCSFTNFFDFSGYTGSTLEVRNKYNDASPVLTFSTTDGSIELDNDGILRLLKPANEMFVRSGTYVFDMILSSAQYKKRGFMKGNFIIEESVTR